MSLRQIKRIAHDGFSVFWLNTKSFYHGLKVNMRSQELTPENTLETLSNFKKNVSKFQMCMFT